jgi:hypothetical protein
MAWADSSPLAKAAFYERQPLLRLVACSTETALNLVGSNFDIGA